VRRVRRKSRERAAGGFTLGELVATIVIAGMLAGLALAGFDEIGDRARSRSTLQEAQALSREARGLAGLDGRSTLLAIDFTDNDLDRYRVGTQLAASTEGNDAELGPYWLYTSKYRINARMYADGLVVLEDGEPVAPFASVGTLAVNCIGGGVTTCTDTATEEAMYLTWEATEQNSVTISVAPGTAWGDFYSSSSNTMRYKYLGLGTRGTTYTITVDIYETNDFTGPSQTSVLQYTVPQE